MSLHYQVAWNAGSNVLIGKGDAIAIIKKYYGALLDLGSKFLEYILLRLYYFHSYICHAGLKCNFFFMYY